MVEEKKRIQWIDLAKGFCILLVVLQHASELTHVDYPLSVQAFGFRMPLYFILSGLFFKQYEGRVLVIESDQMDFENNPEDFRQIINKIDAQLFGLFSQENWK